MEPLEPFDIWKVLLDPSEIYPADDPMNDDGIIAYYYTGKAGPNSLKGYTTINSHFENFYDEENT